MRIKTKYTLAEVSKKAAEKLRDACLDDESTVTAIGMNADGEVIAECCNILGLAFNTEIVSVMYFGPEDENDWFRGDREEDLDPLSSEFWDDQAVDCCADVFYICEGKRKGKGGNIYPAWHHLSRYENGERKIVENQPCCRFASKNNRKLGPGYSN